jgi:hypothetical protein
MSLTFPASPSTGDTYTAASNTWYWDGTKWHTYGIQGAIGPAGATGTAGNDLPKITAVTYADSGYTSNGASKIEPNTTGYIYLTGSNFQSECENLIYCDSHLGMGSTEQIQIAQWLKN